VSLARHLYASVEHPTHVYAYQQPFAEHKLSQGQDFADKEKHFAIFFLFNKVLPYVTF